jgi:hypothetical protein
MSESIRTVTGPPACRSCATSELPDLVDDIRSFPAALTDPHEGLHGNPALLAIAQIAFAYSLADQFGHGGLFSASTVVERFPQLVIDIKLNAPRDVHCASC